MARSRDAVDTIKGYYYQFDYFIFQLISLVNEEDAVTIEALCNIKPFEWSMINSGSKFDAIIGNPPYVKTEDIHILETEAEFAVYKKKYKSAYKQLYNDGKGAFNIIPKEMIKN